MKYTTSQISKAGNIMTSSQDVLLVAEAVAKVNEWRENHLPVIEGLMAQIKELFQLNHILPTFDSIRLKRMTSIQYKLDLNPDMSLGGMQDIAGGRLVFDDVETLEKAFSLLKNNCFESYEIVKEDNYLTSPKPSGYRSIHLVYKYHSKTNEDWDKMKVEIQLRTKLQHSWAMAVETAGLITNTAMKSGQGSDEWQEFFRTTSCIFSIEEDLPIMRDMCNLSKEELVNHLRIIDANNNFYNQLLALGASVKWVEKELFNNELFLLYIDFDKKVLNIKSFAQEEREKANTMYTMIEKGIDDHKNAIVLVSVSQYKDLKEAYPSYFLNMSDFANTIGKYLA